MKVIGLTGGIASGKSTVSNILKELGAVVIDVDLVSRDVVSQGEIAYTKIIENFGRDILMTDGSINRKKLGNIVFSDHQKLMLLNQITHPEIIKKVKEIIVFYEKEHKKVVVVDAAILIEMGLYKHVDCIWLVVVDKETQLMRLIERDKLSRNDAQNRINAQITDEQRMEYANVVIDNTQSLNKVREKVRELWHNI
ncbi:MAG: dephospho-CoA kinase [Lutisporaceae bacterium]